MHPRLEVRLTAFAAARMGRGFAWGWCDCNTLALEALDLIAGTQFAFEVFGRYRDTASARAFFAIYPRDWLHWTGYGEEVAPAFVRTGDFLVADEGGWRVPHVAVGGQALICTPDRGVRTYPVAVVRRLYPLLRAFRPFPREVV